MVRADGYVGGSYISRDPDAAVFVFCAMEEGPEGVDGGDGRREGMEAFYCVRWRLSDLLCICREGDVRFFEGDMILRKTL